MEDLAWASDSFGSLFSESEASFVQPKIKKLCVDDESWFSEAEHDFSSDFECRRSRDKKKTMIEGMGSNHQRSTRGKSSQLRNSGTIGVTPRQSPHHVETMFPDVDDFLSELESEAETVVTDESKGRNRQGRKDSKGIGKRLSRNDQNNEFVGHDCFSENEVQYDAQRKRSENERRRKKQGVFRSKANAENAWDTGNEMGDTLKNMEKKKRREPAVASGEFDSERQGLTSSRSMNKQTTRSVKGERRKVTDDRNSETDRSLSPGRKGRKTNIDGLGKELKTEGVCTRKGEDRTMTRGTADDSEESDSENVIVFATRMNKESTESVTKARRKLAYDIGSETESSLSPKKNDTDKRSRGNGRSTPPADSLQRDGTQRNTRRSALPVKAADELKSRRRGCVSSGHSEASDERKSAQVMTVEDESKGRRKSRQDTSRIMRSTSRQNLARRESERSFGSSNRDTDSERSGRVRRASISASTDDEGERTLSKSMSSRNEYKIRSSLLGQDETEVTEDECESELDLSPHRRLRKSKSFDEYESDRKRSIRKGSRKPRESEFDYENDMVLHNEVRTSKRFGLERADSSRRNKLGMPYISTDVEHHVPRQERRSTIQHADDSEKGVRRQERRSTIQHADGSEKGVRRQERRSTIQHADESDKGVRKQERRSTIQHADDSEKGVRRQERRCTIQHATGSERDAPRQERRSTLQHQTRQGSDRAVSRTRSVSRSKERNSGDRNPVERPSDGDRISTGKSRDSSCLRERRGSTLGSDYDGGQLGNRGISYLPSALGTRQRHSSSGGPDGGDKNRRKSSLKDLLVPPEEGVLPDCTASLPDRLCKNKPELANSSASVQGDVRAGSACKQRSASTTRKQRRSHGTRDCL